MEEEKLLRALVLCLLLRCKISAHAELYIFLLSSSHASLCFSRAPTVMQALCGVMVFRSLVHNVSRTLEVFGQTLVQQSV
jgi:hypothetical protein